MATGIPFLGIVAVLSSLIPVFTGIARLRYLERSERLFLILLMLQAVDSMLQWILASQNINNLWVIHFYILIDLPLLLIIYGMAWEAERYRILATMVSVVYVLVWVASKFYVEPLNQHSIYLSPISRALIAMLSAFTIFRLAQISAISVLKVPMFWFGTAMMLSSAGSLMFYAMSKLMMTTLTVDQVLAVYSIFWSFMIFINLVFSWGFLCKPFQSKSGGRLASAQ